MSNPIYDIFICSLADLVYSFRILVTKDLQHRNYLDFKYSLGFSATDKSGFN